jgi:hypothetical protein
LPGGVIVGQNELKKAKAIMRRIWILALAASVALSVPSTLKADDEPETTPPEGRRRGQLSEAQKALRKEMLLKYDKNKNGQIDPEERAAITPEDQERLARAGLTIPPRRRRPDGK